MKILANDGISPEGIERLEENGFEVVTEKVTQENLAQAINDENYVGLLVRSATTVRKDLIDQCDGLKFIGRGGVGMDNIDVDYARSKGIVVANTPASSSQSVAELVLGSLFSLARSTFDSYKQMSINGNTEFKKLKKKYAKGIELRGRTLLIVGFGRIGQSLASYALGAGMKVKGVDIQAGTVDVPVEIEGAGTVTCKVQVNNNLEEVIGEADFISLHVPKQADGSAVITKQEIDKMRDGVRLVNASRGGVIDENDLIEALNSGKVAAAALDVFDNEPTPSEKILQHESIACTPHIGAATNEAQARIGLELADTIIASLK
jgi:D-3-phosphoglycerate dehydrogenase